MRDHWITTYVLYNTFIFHLNKIFEVSIESPDECGNSSLQITNTILHGLADIPTEKTTDSVPQVYPISNCVCEDTNTGIYIF